MTLKAWGWLLAVVGAAAIALGFVVQSSQNHSAAVALFAGAGYSDGRNVLPALLWAGGALAIVGAVVIAIAMAPRK